MFIVNIAKTEIAHGLAEMIIAWFAFFTPLATVIGQVGKHWQLRI